MTRGRTLTLPASRRREIQERCIGSAGPRPSILGMRRLYWGRDALVIRIGAYAYYMGRDAAVQQQTQHKEEQR